MKKYLVLIILSVILVSCNSRNQYVPKPKGYFRIHLPEKEYQWYESECNFKFQYPVYSKIVPVNKNEDQCWLNIEFPEFNGKIHITYKKVNNNLATYTEDVRLFANKHITMADDIVEIPVVKRDKKIYGMVYDIKGNTASSYNFYITDSTKNFLSGALYFFNRPNKDSIAPVRSFIIKDIEQLIETFEWK